MDGGSEITWFEWAKDSSGFDLILKVCRYCVKMLCGGCHFFFDDLRGIKAYAETITKALRKVVVGVAC